MNPSQARETLKQFKNGGFISSSLSLLIEFEATRGRSLLPFAGEFCHQIGLRYQSRREYDKAIRMFLFAEETLRDNPLGLARVLRDHGLLLALLNQADEGIDLIEQALDLHVIDIKSGIDLTKGRRQQRITESFQMRAIMLSEAGSQDAKQAAKKLLDLALSPEFDFCDRDKLAIIDALIASSETARHRKLLATRGLISAKENDFTKAVESAALYFLDVQVSLAAAVLRRLFR